VQDAVHHTEQPLGAVRDDGDETLLPWRQRAGDAIGEEMGGLADRGERGPELMREVGVYLLLHAVELTQTARHGVERLRELAELVAPMDRHRLLQGALREERARRRQT